MRYAACVLAAAGIFQTAPVRWAPALDAIERAVATWNRPAIVVAVTDREKTLGLFAHGYADLKTKKPIAADSPFAIGSISKSFTAIALMQLWDEGRFDPQAPIAMYLPWFAVKSSFGPITGHHLLTHTAGLPNYRADLASVPFARTEGRPTSIPSATCSIRSSTAMRCARWSRGCRCIASMSETNHRTRRPDVPVVSRIIGHLA